MELTFSASGVAIERGPHGVRLLAEAARKREIIEMLWTAGCDVVSVNPVKDSLQGIFLSTVGGAS
jgi:hypothetical protein